MTTPYLAAGTFRTIQAAALSAQVTDQQRRADFIEELYRRSGRTNGLYTGLYQEFKQRLLDDFIDHLAESRRTAWCLDNERQQRCAPSQPE